jgi:hypothetical protein
MTHSPALPLTHSPAPPIYIAGDPVHVRLATHDDQPQPARILCSGPAGRLYIRLATGDDALVTLAQLVPNEKAAGASCTPPPPASDP